jgi:hypothetical protein
LPRVSERVASTSLRCRRGSTQPALRLGSGEARCRDGRVCVVTCDFASCRTEASADVRCNAFIPLRASGSAVPGACPLRKGDSVRTPSGVLSGTGNVADRFECQVALPRKYTSCSSRSGSRGLAAAVILCSGPKGTGGRAFAVLASRAVSPKIEKPHG